MSALKAEAVPALSSVLHIGNGVRVVRCSPGKSVLTEQQIWATAGSKHAVSQTERMPGLEEHEQVLNCPSGSYQAIAIGWPLVLYLASNNAGDSLGAIDPLRMASPWDTRESAPVCLCAYIFLGESPLSLSLLPSQPHKQASGQNHYATIFQFIQCLQLLISFCLLHKEGTLSEAVSKELTGASSSIWTLEEETRLTTGHFSSNCRDFLYHSESTHHLFTEAK
ncbi:unnamed protein product [Leuciscus chuanchicus]